MKRNHSAEPTHDLVALAEDAKALLVATAEVAGEKVVAARERLAAALERARKAALEGAKATDKAIRDNPYRAVGIAFGVGALVGLLLTRRNKRLPNL